MDYQNIGTLLSALRAAYEKICGEVQFVKGPPASEREVEDLEAKLRRKLPRSLKNFFMGFSRELRLNAFLPDDFTLPDGLRGIFSASFLFSLQEVENAEESRKSWASQCFTDPNHAYDRVWHGKLGLMTVPNGDVIALDTASDENDPPVVYLSHDDGDSHGYVLGKTLDAYLERLLLVGGCGNEEWQMAPFLDNAVDGLNPDCENARAYREIIMFPAGNDPA